MNQVRTGVLLAATAAAMAMAGCQMTPRRAAVVAPVQACEDFDFAVYFATNSDQLTGPALQLMADAARRSASCRVNGVKVRGLSAPSQPGSPTPSDLSQRRADAVSRALATQGLPGPAFEVEAEAVPAATPGPTEPLGRRVDVLIDLSPKS